MELLFVIGLTLFLGTLGGKICQQFKVPQVTGYILVGLLLGNNFFALWTPSMIADSTLVVNIALGLIGFMIGFELKLDMFRKRGASIYSILFCEGLVTFICVASFVSLLTQKIYLGILFGALASATAPAATVDVLWENKTRGPLTTTLLAIVALDDVLALVLYGFASVIAKSLITHEHYSLMHTIEAPIIEIGFAIALGVGGAVLLYWLTYFIKDRERILPFSLGVITFTVGLAVHFHIDLILSSMILGFTLTNISKVDSKEIFDSIKKFSAPIYVLFFVLVGARLDFNLVFASGVGALVIVYMLSRTFGKMAGSLLGGFIGRAHPSVTKYLGMCLFSQAGVAIGMAISIDQSLQKLGSEAAGIGIMIINVIVATTFVVQIIGPLCVRFAVGKANEVGRDVTEEDIIASHKVSDVIEKNVPIIREDMQLHAMIEQVKKSESCDFCVVDHQGRLLGNIAIGDLRDVLLEQELELNTLILSKDIAVPAPRVIAADRPLSEAIEIFRRKELDFLPVVKDEETKELVGLIHYRVVMSEMNKELLLRRGNN
jgi:Kef-type K+ transport system membrane component KefB/CBS domain-containing protein